MLRLANASIVVALGCHALLVLWPSVPLVGRYAAVICACLMLVTASLRAMSEAIERLRFVITIAMVSAVFLWSHRLESILGISAAILGIGIGANLATLLTRRGPSPIDLNVARDAGQLIFTGLFATAYAVLMFNGSMRLAAQILNLTAIVFCFVSLAAVTRAVKKSSGSVHERLRVVALGTPLWSWLLALAILAVYFIHASISEIG